MQLLNTILDLALTVTAFVACIAAVVMWWRSKGKPHYAESNYWAYVTIGLFFIFVSKYADVYAPLVPTERALYVYATTSLLCMGVLFVFIAVKRLCATLFDLHS